MRKKEKIIWIDDGRTIADMSGVPGGQKRTANPSVSARYHAPLREQLRTFFHTMGFLLLPTLAVLGILAAAFLIVYFLL